MHLFFSDSHNIYENLALEDYLLRFAKKNHYPSILIYRNSPSIVIGRFQNPWRECDLEKVQQSSIALARRQSGGGTVYHDLGNINFCLFQQNTIVNKSVLLNWLIDFFHSFSVKLNMNERFDLVIEQRAHLCKVSGSAYKQTKEGSFHHCTMLVNADLAGVKKYLHHDFDFEFHSKSVSSVRSQVTNLAEVKQTLNCDLLIQSLQDKYSFEILNVQDILREFSQVNDFHKKMKSEEWILGETPKFTATRTTSTGLESFEIEKGRLIASSKQLAQVSIGDWFRPGQYE